MNSKAVQIETPASPLTRKIRMKWASPRFYWGFGAVAAFLVFWELAAVLGWVNKEYTSRLTQVLAAGYEMVASGNLFYHLYISLLELAIGFVLASFLGLLTGLLMGHYRILGNLFDPFIMALYATPRVALIPLFVVWFGVGMESKVFVVFIGAIFPVLVNTMTGIRQVDPLLLRLGRSYCASERRIFVKILLPAALPAMMTGLRLGWGRGILGVIIGEMYVSMAGLGHLISTSGNAMRTDELFFLVLVVAGLGYLATNGFRLLERKLTPWNDEGGRA